MGPTDKGQHAVDQEVHTVGGWFILAMGATGTVGSTRARRPIDLLLLVANASLPIGSVFFGAALLSRPGSLRGWLLGICLMCMASLPVLLAIAFSTA